MSNFKLEDSIEYRQIKSVYRVIENIFGTSDQNIITLAAKSFQMILSQLEREIADISKTSSLQNECVFLYARQELLSSFVNQADLEPLCREFGLKLSKEIGVISAISIYAFAKRLLWHDFTADEEIKTYRAGTAEDSVDTKMGRQQRKKAEEFYKNGYSDNAYLSFLSADERNFGDFLTSYQLGLICFFDKLDYETSLGYFKKAAKHALGRSKKIYMMSNLFTGLISRLYGAHTNDDAAIESAYKLIKHTYESAPGELCAAYAYAQCMAVSPSYTSKLQLSMNIMLELLKKNNIYLIQMIYDRAFDNLLEEIDLLYNGIYNEAFNGVTETLNKIEEYLERMSQDSSYSAIPSKIAAIKAEFRDIKATLEDDKTYFRVLAIKQKTETLNDNLQTIIKEIKENKNFFEFQAFLEDIAKKCKYELNEEILKPFVKAEREYDNKLFELVNLNKSYPVIETEMFLNSHKKTSVSSNSPMPTDDWRNAKIYSLIKYVTGCFVFMLVFTFLFAYALINSRDSSGPFIVLAVSNIVISPLYAFICGRIYYSFIEAKRKGLINNINRLNDYIASSEKKKQELLRDTKKKYTKLIIEKKNVTLILAEQILDSSMEGKYEKVKALVS